MLQCMRCAVELEVCFVNTLSFTGQSKYYFSIFICLLILINVKTRLASVTVLNFVR